MPLHEQTLQRLGLSFTVRDIMISKEHLVSASAKAEAPAVSERYPQYNVIPILEGGILVEFYERDKKASRPITVQDLVGSDTSIMGLVEVLSDREFCFALVGNEIGGYAHFSDLNNPIVKLTFYVIFEAFERHLLLAINPVTEEEIQRNLGQARLNRIRDEMRKAQADNANLSLSLESFLFLPEILRIAIAKGKLAQDKEQDKSIRAFRNRVSHAGWSLIQRHGDVKALVEVKRFCLSVLDGETQVQSRSAQP